MHSLLACLAGERFLTCKLGRRQIGWRFVIRAAFMACAIGVVVVAPARVEAQTAIDRWDRANSQADQLDDEAARILFSPNCFDKEMIELLIRRIDSVIGELVSLTDNQEVQLMLDRRGEARRDPVVYPLLFPPVRQQTGKTISFWTKILRSKVDQLKNKICPPPPPPEPVLNYRVPGSEFEAYRIEISRSGRNWTGPSFGVETLENFGRVETIESFRETGQTTFKSTDSGDPLGIGVTVGYTFAPYSNGLLLSPFLSVDFLTQTINHTFAGGTFFGTTTHWIGTFGAKVGMAPRPDLFLYGLLGGSMLNEDLNINFGGPVTSQNVTVPGFTLGLGAAFKPSMLQGFGVPVSVFAQYQHTWWAEATLNAPAASPLFNYNFRRQDDTIRLGVNLHFGAPPPAEPARSSMPVKAPVLK